MSEKSATAIDQMVSATAQGNAPAINIVLGTNALKPFAWFAGVVLAAGLLVALLACGIAVYTAGVTRSDNAAAIERANDKVSEANVNLRQLWYWNQMAYAQMEAIGMHMSPPPKPATIKEK